MTPWLRDALRFWLPVGVYMAAIFYVSSLPQPPMPPGPDKPWHALAYFGLALLVVRGLAGGLPRRIGARTAAAAIAIAVTYGLTDEIHQRFVPGRSADVNDLIADAAGACLGAAACWAWGILSRASRHEL